MATPRAFITGVGGQDGSLLAALLLDNGYEVVGVVRRDPAVYADALAPLEHRLELVEADLLDHGSLVAALRATRPDGGVQPRGPVLRAALVGRADPDGRVRRGRGDLDARGDPRGRPGHPLLPGVVERDLRRAARDAPDGGHSPGPLTPYGVAKAYAHFIAGSYRRRYGMFTSCGILYNHESPLRPVDFLPRKVARAAAAISLGLERELVLGDLSARRDWGYAGDYVRAMWLMLQHDEPGDYVVATGVSHSVEDLVACAFDAVSLDWRDHVRTDPSLFRGAAELHDLVGDASKARRVLGWEPEVTLERLLAMMVEADVARLSQAAASS